MSPSKKLKKLSAKFGQLMKKETGLELINVADYNFVGVVSGKVSPVDKIKCSEADSFRLFVYIDKDFNLYAPGENSDLVKQERGAK